MQPILQMDRSITGIIDGIMKINPCLGLYSLTIRFEDTAGFEDTVKVVEQLDRQ